MDVNGGQLTQTNGNPIFPGSTFTGPLLAGNVFHSDGSGTAAGLGNSGTSGTANVGYVLMAQSAVITQTTGALSTAIVIPAQSQITGMQLMVTTVWSTGTTTMGVGATAGTTNATAFTSASAIQGSTLGLVTGVTPTTAAQIANWDNVSNSTFQTNPTDVIIEVTSGGGAGTGVGTFTVFYLQGVNMAS
jgi:hypothetical protein